MYNIRCTIRNAIRYNELLLKKCNNEKERDTICGIIRDNKLLLAVCNNKKELVHNFLKDGGGLPKKEELTSLAVYLSIKNRNPKILGPLLNFGADVNLIIKNDLTAVEFATKGKRIGCLKELIKRKPDWDKNFSSLYIAAVKGYDQCLKILIEGGVDFKKQCDGISVIHIAAEKSTECLKELIEAGSDINCLTNKKQTPLMIACMNEEIESVKLLLEKGAEINLLDDDNMSALHYAVKYKNLKIMKMLINKGAKLDVESVFGCTPFHIAKKISFIKGMEMLIKKGASEKNTDLLNFFEAIEKGDVEFLKGSLKKFNINAVDFNGDTPILIAIRNASETTFINPYSKLLVAEELHESVVIRKKQLECLEVLLKAGADKNKRNSFTGISPVYLATTKNNVKALELLLKDNKVDLEFISKKIPTPLFEAVSCNYQECLKLLIKAGANVNASFGKETPTFVAVRKNHKECLKQLIEAGADVEKGFHGVTPFNIASWEDPKECEQLNKEEYSKQLEKLEGLKEVDYI